MVCRLELPLTSLELGHCRFNWTWQMFALGSDSNDCLCSSSGGVAEFTTAPVDRCSMRGSIVSVSMRA